MIRVQRSAMTLGRPAAGAIAILLATLLLVPVLLAASAVAAPPVSGAMQNFIVHDEPKPAPDISFQDGAGSTLTLAGFAGRVVLVNLWATWCGPCRVEMPELDELQGALGGPGFEVVALSGDRAGISAVDAFYAEIGVKHLGRYVDKSMASHRALQAKGLPTTILIDGQGREVGRMVGPANWASAETKALIRYYIERTARPADKTKETRLR